MKTKVAWDTEDIGSNSQVINDLTVKVHNTSDNIVKTTSFKTKGKYYSEFSYTGNNTLMLGVLTDKVLKTQGYGYDGTYFIYCYNGNIYTISGYEECIIGGITENDIMGILLDCDNHIVQFSKNGKVCDKKITIPDEPMSIGASLGSSYDTTIIHANFGSKKFRYTIPKGYVPYDISCGYLISSNGIYYTMNESNTLNAIGKNIPTINLIYNINNDILCDKISELFNNYNIIKIKEGGLDE